MESAKDIKKGLESPPRIAVASVAECKINQSVTSAGATNNKILGITKYDNFSLTSKSMCVWQAYNVGEGINIEGSWNVQNASGLERIGNWRKRYRVLQKKNARQRENTMSLSLSILVAALNLLVLPPSRQSKRRMSTWTQVIIF